MSSKLDKGDKSRVTTTITKVVDKEVIPKPSPPPPQVKKPVNTNGQYVLIIILFFVFSTIGYKMLSFIELELIAQLGGGVIFGALIVWATTFLE